LAKYGISFSLLNFIYSLKAPFFADSFAKQLQKAARKMLVNLNLVCSGKVAISPTSSFVMHSFSPFTVFVEYVFGKKYNLPKSGSLSVTFINIL